MNTNFKQAIRHLSKDKTNTIINIAGLTLGFSIVTLITLFLINELGYNNSVKKRNRIYRVLNYDENQQKTWTTSPYILGEYAKKNIAGIESVTQLSSKQYFKIKKDNEWITENGVICTNGSFFDMFSVKLLQGKVSPDFDKTGQYIFVSQSLANKYFKTTDVVGEELMFKMKDTLMQMQIMGVYEDIPNNSSIKSQIIGSMALDFQTFKQRVTVSTTGDNTKFDLDVFYHSWQNSQSLSTFLLLENNADINTIQSKLTEISRANSSEHFNLNFSLQALQDIYFGSKEFVDNTNLDKGNLSMIYIMAVVGLLILIIASINYLNLSSAQAFMRSKNLSINKIFGAKRSALIGQMILESVLIAFIALPLAMFIAYDSLPYLNKFLGHDYELLFTNNIALAVSIIITLALFVGIMSGWLVARKITSVNMTEALKGKNLFAGNKLFVRKATITFQFTVFIVLIAIVFGVQKQIKYVMNTDMGFKKEGLLKISKGDRNFNIYKQEILKNPNVLSVGGAMWLPPSDNSVMYMALQLPDKKKLRFRGNLIDYGFVETMGLQIIEGEDFDKEKHKSGVLLSESAAKLLETDEELIGRNIAYGKVIGIVSDFNMSSLHSQVQPVILLLQPTSCRDIAVRINTKNIQETIQFLESEYNKIDGKTPFSYQFTDDVLAEMYKSDTRFAQTIGLLAFIAVFIASLGLFGLSVLIGKRRTKEIGIRKINGASIGEILKLLNYDFIKLIIIAFVIATPIAYYAINKWLESFAYKTSLSWWIFALAGLSALAIAMLTVSWQSWRTASRNPVEALRYE